MDIYRCTDSDEYPKFKEPPEVTLSLHPMKPPGVMDDYRFLLEISIRRISKTRLDDELNRFMMSGLYKKSDEIKRKNSTWFFEVHKQTDRLDKGGYIYYRRDFEMPNGEILSAKAEYINLKNKGKALFIDEDDKAIRRIIDSIKPLK